MTFDSQALPATKERRAELQKNLAAVTARLDKAVAAAGREAGSVTLLPVTKFHHPQDVVVLEGLGVKAVGENRVGEAAGKHRLAPGMHFHLIGEVQTKKANAAARFAHSVHSVDSEKIARALDRGCALAVERGEREPGNLLEVFLQYSFDGDPHRGGTGKQGVRHLAELVSAELPHLVLAGVMCMPPLGEEPARVFAAAKTLTDDLSEKMGTRLALSAGMSGDLEQAVAHGSDLVRVGTAIMGPRPLN